MSAAAAKNSKKTKAPSKTPDKSAALILFAVAADTTWRMFVPTLGGTILGLWIDSLLDTEPWYGIGGLALGIAITAGLIRQQYMKEDKK